MPKDTDPDIRDWLAAKALVALMRRGFSEFGNSQHAYAKMAYEYADAMLEARLENTGGD